MSDKHEEDLAFISSLKTNTIYELNSVLKNHSHQDTPRWKRVAIRRAISKLSYLIGHNACSLDWILGLNELDIRQLDSLLSTELIRTIDRIEGIY
jgi:hypothetical protein